MAEAGTDTPSRGAKILRRWGPRKLRALAIGIALLVLTIFGYWLLFRWGYVSTDDANIDADLATISALLLGRIERLTVDEGDTVRKGELLVGLDQADLQAEVAVATAQLQYAQRSIAAANATLAQARRDFARTGTLRRGGAVAQQQYEQSREALELATARELQAVADEARSSAALAKARADLAKTIITAPFDGAVAKRWVLSGDVVQPGQPILALYALPHVWVTANFEETKVGHLQPGNSAKIAVDAYPHRTLHGKVLVVGQATAAEFALIPPSNAAGNFTKVVQRVPVKISVEQPPGNQLHLVPGMSVEVKVRYRK